jgi:exopolyphosphatase/guanosine-5'-triphosphate,3'-diphosphate pyrophosphatase
MRDAAVVDVGSNSIRLVIYRIEGRAILPLLNERAAVGLGRGLRETGVLSPEGVVEAIAALKRFRLFLDARGVNDVIAVATAAVREAADGPDFAATVAEILRAELSVIAGEEEARASALGVIAGEPDATGVVGDLGGSSLEFAGVVQGEVTSGVTMPLGPFALASACGGDVKAARKIVDAQVSEVVDRLAAPRDLLYAVGGAWRAIARIALETRDHPVRVLHAYEMSAAEAVDLAKFVSKQSVASLASVREVSRRRAETLPLAAAVLERSIKRLGVKRVRIQAYGLREGLLFTRMGADERAGDPLIAGLEALTRRTGGIAAIGPAIETWLDPAREVMGTAFGPERDPILYSAACRTADLAGRHHPDHRAELGALETLYAPVAGVSHEERVFLALTVHHRYGGRREPAALAAPLRLLGRDARDTALKLGLALRFACTFSARAASLLEHAGLEVTDKEAVLRVTEIGRGLYTSAAERRFQQFAAAVERTPKLVEA